MNYEEFSKELQENVQGRMAGVTVEFKEVVKSNVGKKAFLMLRAPEDVITPNFYLEPLFVMYQRGKSIEEIAEDIIKEYQEGREGLQTELRNFDIHQFEQIKDNLFFKILQAERNREFLSGVMHEEFLDFAVVFCLAVSLEGDGVGTLYLTEDVVKHWEGVSKEEIIRLAKENTPRLFPVKLCGLKDIIVDMLGGMEEESEQLCEEIEASFAYVLTNQRGVNGFSAVLYPGVIKEFADKLGTDLVVLPSSLHEALLIPVEEETDFASLREMVQQVNQEAVSPEDYLSDNIYLFHRENEILEIVKEGVVLHV